MRGHIHKRERQGRNGKTVRWYVVVDIGSDGQGRRKQKWHGGYSTRREAERALAGIVGSLEKQTYVAPTQVTVASFARDEWLPMMRTQVKLSTWDSYRRNLEKHVLPVLGGKQLQQITGGHLNTLYRSLLTGGARNSRDGGLAPKTVRNIHIAISKLLADALDHGLISRNVAANARPPKPRKIGSKEIRFWTPKELSKFLAFARQDRWYALWHLAAMTGMRRGELLGLRWADVDLVARRVSVRQALISVAYELTFTTPKSHSARVIDIDPETVEVLKRYRDVQQTQFDAAGAHLKENQLVFAKEDGATIHPDIIRQMFDKRVKRSGLRRIRFHDLRHTHATIGLRAGVPVKVMSERLGHSTPAFTLQQYAHVIPGMQAEAAEAIARLVSDESDDVDEPDDCSQDEGDEEKDGDDT